MKKVTYKILPILLGTLINSALASQSIQASVILMAGVEFMAESVKLLNPDKTVIVPDLNAGCPLVKAYPYNEYLKCRQKNPIGMAVTYINSSAEVKFIGHPECDESVLQYADIIGSTSRLLEEVKSNPAKTFIVATETGILHQTRKVRPDAILIQAPGPVSYPDRFSL
jgi:quinolinate synthase